MFQISRTAGPITEKKFTKVSLALALPKSRQTQNVYKPKSQPVHEKIVVSFHFASGFRPSCSAIVPGLFSDNC